jgi:hypothetical protein
MNQLLADFSEENGIRVTSRQEFHDEEGGKTRVVLRAGPFPEHDAEDTQAGRESSFTKLDAVLRAA